MDWWEAMLLGVVCVLIGTMLGVVMERVRGPDGKCGCDVKTRLRLDEARIHAEAAVRRCDDLQKGQDALLDMGRKTQNILKGLCHDEAVRHREDKRWSQGDAGAWLLDGGIANILYRPEAKTRPYFAEARGKRARFSALAAARSWCEHEVAD